MSRKSQDKQHFNTLRCAIYTRKSTDEGLEKEFNSLDAQRDACEAYIRSQQHQGWTLLPQLYDDGGFTGGNMERPALKRLMTDIEAGQIDCVVIYKVDRLSRSLLDFARMMETFEKRKVSFVSITQQFNTATSMGRLVLNVLLSFAQFEREIISERTRDKIAASRRKGKWVGGHPLLGYDVDPQTFKLTINPDEAEQVREIFRLYLEHGSLLPAVLELERRGWVNKRWQTRKGGERGGKPFDRTALHRLLTNVTYIGQVRHKRDSFVGEHPAIVDEATFTAVQAMLRTNRRDNAERRRSTNGFLLQGLLRCLPCDSAMTPTYTTRNRSKRFVEAEFHVERGIRGEKRICSGPSPVAEPGRIPRVARLMALAIRFDKLIRDGVITDQAELARLGGVTRARITQIMNLLQLAPDSQEQILFLPRVTAGTDPIILAQLQPIARELDWGLQRLLWRALAQGCVSMRG